MPGLFRPDHFHARIDCRFLDVANRVRLPETSFFTSVVLPPLAVGLTGKDDLRPVGFHLGCRFARGLGVKLVPAAWPSA